MNAFLPFGSLVAEQRELGLVVAVLIGFAFGFVLERAGFGRAQKLVGQFLLSEMTVLKVMFGAVATAMVGAVVLSGVGVIELRAVADTATSPTWIWPMLVGGFVVGLGFVISAYCPGTSVVAMASGKVDGLFTVIGVVLGSLVAGELLGLPAVARFNDSGDLGHVYLYDLLHVPPAVVAAAVAAIAIAAFLGAEKLEAVFGKDARPESPARPRRLVFAGMAATALVGLVTIALPRGTGAAPAAPAAITAEALARKVIEAPWKVRVLDLRALEACGKARVPGAECVPAAELGKLGLADVVPEKLVVLVGDGALAEVPRDARAYRGEVAVLQGGFAAWSDYALTPPAAPGPAATPAEWDAYRVRAGLHAALTGVKQAPPPAPVPGAAPARRKAGGGGCSG